MVKVIYVDRVSKSIETAQGRLPIFEDLSAVLPTNRRLAILGLPGSGRSTLVELLSGLQKPDSGRIVRDVTVSIPVGGSMGLIPKQSLRRNCVFAARLHGIDAVDLIRFVANVGGIGRHLDTPLRDVAPNVNRCFRFALTYGLPFETYVVDGSPFPRGLELRKRFEPVVGQRTATSGFIICTSNARSARSFCDTGAILHEGRLKVYSDFDRALAVFSMLKTRYGAVDGSAMSEANLLKAKRALRNRNFDLVEEIADAEAEQDGENGIALWLLGEVALSRGNRPDGVALIIQACETGTVLEEPWAALSRLATEETDQERKRAMATLMLEHKSSAVRQNGARLIDSFDDTMASISAWRDVLRSNPDDPSILLDAAKTEVQAGHLIEALSIIERALEIDAQSWRVLLAKVRIEQALGRFEDMSATVIDLARIRPNAGRRFIRPLVSAGMQDAANRVREITDGRDATNDAS